MVSAVLYDDNPTVRSILKIALASLGFDIIPLSNIQNCEQVFEQNKRKQLMAIIDASRISEHLNYLQRIIPRYIPQQEYCILTTIYPAVLMKFQPQDGHAPFFQHILERPFRLQAFIDFVWKTAAPMLSTSQILRRSPQSVVPEVSETSDTSVRQAPREQAAVSSVEQLVENNVENTEIMACVDLNSMALPVSEVENVGMISSLPEKPLESGRICGNMVTRLINRACKRQLSYAIEFESEDRHSLVILSDGDLLWAETYSTDKLADTETFLRLLNVDHLVPVNAVCTLLNQNMSLSSVIATLNLTDVFGSIAEDFIKKNLFETLLFKDGNYRIFHAGLDKYKTIINQRPVCAVPAASTLFEYHRNHSFIDELPLIHPEMSFIARPYRSMLNAKIRVSKAESDFIDVLRKPRTYKELTELQLPDFLCTLHRLISFDFIDFYFPNPDE